MKNFTEAQLRELAFERLASVLHGFWEEQRDTWNRNGKINIALSTRIFETLIYNRYICKGKSEALRNAQASGGSVKGEREHLVPCVVLRNESFQMFAEGKSLNEVATMLKQYLCIAYVTVEERKRVDREYKDEMPDQQWRTNNLPETARLDAVQIKITSCAKLNNCSPSKNCL